MSGLLTADEKQQYRDQGYCGPFRLCSSQEMYEIKSKIRDDVLSKPGPLVDIPRSERHVDSRIVYDLCSHQAITERATELLGENIVLWWSSFFDKPPGPKTATPLHNDTHHFPIEPFVNLTAWIALDKVTAENGAMQVVPYSHKCNYPTLPSFSRIGSYKNLDFDVVIDPSYVEPTDLVTIELEAGEFYFFSERMVHGSLANLSSSNRLGLAVRMTIPMVKVYHDLRYEGHGVLLLKGQDQMHLNHVINPPT